MRILHVALITGGAGKQSALRNAFSGLGEKVEIDWMRLRKEGKSVNNAIRRVFENFQPELSFMQLQTPGVVRPEEWNGRYPGKVVNWTGDVRTPIPAWYLELGKKIDWTLFSNETDVETARAHGVRAAFLNIGFDTHLYTPRGRSERLADIVFFGNNYGTRFPMSKERSAMVAALERRYGNRFRVIGANWPGALNLMHAPEREAAIYRGAALAINQNHFLYKRYSSDRIFRILGCGTLCLARRFPRMAQDYREGVHLRSWDTFNALFELIDYYLDHRDEAKRIADAGCRLAHEKNTWPVRLRQLLEIIK